MATSSLRPDLARVQKKLDSLPFKSVIIDKDGQAWQYGFPGYWYRAYDGDGISSFELAQRAETIAVAHKPKGADA
jgi:hypothetical protein